jgi:hypothetical protein
MVSVEFSLPRDLIQVHAFKSASLVCESVCGAADEISSTWRLQCAVIRDHKDIHRLQKLLQRYLSPCGF